MKSVGLLILFILFFFSCKEFLTDKKNKEINVFSEEKEIAINNVEIPNSELVLNPLKGIWYYKGKPYNGYALKFYDNDTLRERLGFYNGKRQGIAKTWSNNGVLRIESYYHQNRLVGEYKSFWENGKIALQVHYVDGKKEGKEKQWYADGTLSKLRWLEKGKERGLQKAWLPNGQLYVNYEAKNGRIFGLMRANSCYKLENEKVIKKK